MEKEVHLMNTDPESGRRRRQNMIKVWSRIFLQAFTLTFLAEWGDRSQLTTIVLAAREVCIFSSDSIILTRYRLVSKPWRRHSGVFSGILCINWNRVGGSCHPQFSSYLWSVLSGPKDMEKHCRNAIHHQSVQSFIQRNHVVQWSFCSQLSGMY